MFNAILIEKSDGKYTAELRHLPEDRLPEGEVLVEVACSTLNYKDALAITGKGPVVRVFPMVPGIDFAGKVLESEDGRYKPGDLVLLNGWGAGETHWGGLAQKARVKGDWLIPLPPAFTPHQAMAIGTAGYTSMLSVMALQEYGVTPERGEIVVTGAGGGVGGTAIALLAQLGYRVAAVTGRAEEADRLRALGAAEILDRAAFAQPGKPLAKERWAGAVDAAGSHTLANICAATKYHGVVTACGLAQGMDFPATVAPFILRGVRLIGIDSVTCPKERRIAAWNRLAAELGAEKLALIAPESEIGLSETLQAAKRIMDGQVRGRLVVNVTR